MDPIKFHSEDRFKRDWVDYYWQGQFRKEGGIRRIAQFKEYTKDLCIRRERTEVLPELPLINRTKLNFVMDTTQAEAYDDAVEEFVQWYESESASFSGMAIIAMMAKMRHLVALAKIPATKEYVDEFIEDTDRKIVVFAHHEDVQALLYDYFKEKYGDEMPVMKFVAGMRSDEVNTVQSTFNKSPRAILVASQLAAGEGLNLQTCCDCVMHERQWNPGKEEQCEGRFIRIGSTATSVSAVYAHMQGLTAIDSTLDAIIERKRIQFHNVMNKGEATRWSEDAIMKELAETIVRAHNSKKNRKVAAAG
jgi:SNF2 family DNA or RNA helicase